MEVGQVVYVHNGICEPIKAQIKEVEQLTQSVYSCIVEPLNQKDRSQKISKQLSIFLYPLDKKDALIRRLEMELSVLGETVRKLKENEL